MEDKGWLSNAPKGSIYLVNVWVIAIGEGDVDTIIMIMISFSCVWWIIGPCECNDGSATAAASSSSLSGPVFLKEPANRIDFSNTTGTVVECAATGNPRPEILWIKADGSPVTDVPGLRQVKKKKLKKIINLIRRRHLTETKRGTSLA